MLVEQGDKVHIITRRLFESDLRRHFVGEVETAIGALIRVKGYVFIFDESANEFLRKDKIRERVFSMAETGLIVNLLPKETILAEILYQINPEGQRVVTDGKNMSMNINEFGAKR